MDLLRQFRIEKQTDKLVDTIIEYTPHLFEELNSPRKFAQKQQTKVARGMRKSGELNPDILSPGQRAALGMPQKSQENEETNVAPQNTAQPAQPAQPQDQGHGVSSVKPKLVRAYQWILRISQEDTMSRSHVIKILQAELKKKGGLK